jgi:hypothetical protein
VALDRHDLLLFEGEGHNQRLLERLEEEPDLTVFAGTDDLERIMNKAEFPIVVLQTRRVGRREIAAFRRN